LLRRRYGRCGRGRGSLCLLELVHSMLLLLMLLMLLLLLLVMLVLLLLHGGGDGGGSGGGALGVGQRRQRGSEGAVLQLRS